MSPPRVWKLSIYPPTHTSHTQFFYLFGQAGRLFPLGEREKKKKRLTLGCSSLCSALGRLNVWPYSPSSNIKLKTNLQCFKYPIKNEMHGIYCTLLCMNMRLGSYKIWGSGYSSLIYMFFFKNQGRRNVLYSWAPGSGLPDPICTSHTNSFPSSNMTSREICDACMQLPQIF